MSEDPSGGRAGDPASLPWSTARQQEAGRGAAGQEGRGRETSQQFRDDIPVPWLAVKKDRKEPKTISKT